MAWRPAYSLQTLKGQLDSTYPGWLFLGFLGDQAHAGVPGDHNPNSAGVVCALDIGPGGGLDIHILADNIVANPHPDLKYIISNRRIAEWQNGFKWTPYGGSDPHDTHIHVSVGRGPDGQSKQPYDDTIKWTIGGEMVDWDTAWIYADAFWGWGERTDERGDILGRDIVGKRDYRETSHFMFNHEFGVNWRKYIDKLEADANNPSDATVLKPGKYQVK